MKSIIQSNVNYFLLLLFLINSNSLLAQSYSKIRTFTTEDGLPSNHIYDVIEDKKGFLWVATDNGISCFDGKYFKTFTVRNGLPSNDVLHVLEDIDGTIWVNCHKKPPSYFDRDKNEFITLTNSITKKHSNKYFFYYLNVNGYVSFISPSHDYFQLIDKKIIQTNFAVRTLPYKNNVFHCDYITNKKNEVIIDELYITNKAKQRKLLLKKSDVDMAKQFGKEYLFLITKKNLYKISKIDFDGLTAKIDTIRLKKDFKWFKSSGNSLCINNIDNSVGVFDLNTLKLIASVDNPIKLNLAYSDKKNNIWLCTVNDGLVLYQKKSIQNKTFSGLTKNKNFLSCAFDAQGSFYAGNDMGEVIESTNSLAKKHSVKSEVVTIWVRKIICSSDKIVAVHDRGVSINFGPSKTIIRNDKNLNSTKSTVKVNDSIILLGTNNGLIKYNIITHDYAHRNSPDIGVTDIIKATDALFYFIGGNSLYQYDYAKNSFSEIVLSKKETQDSPTFLGYDDNNILWVSTITGNILGLKNNKVIKTISNTIGLPENITCLLAVENKLWIGSKSGIFILDTANNTFDKLTTIDGLSTSFINALTLNNKTVFAATTEGITKIPSQIILPKFDIVPQIVALKINNKNTKIASSYDLDSNQNSIFIELAGTELTGHFKNFQYAINTTKEWNVVSENNLSLRLNSGVSTIYIRATNSNNQVGSKMIVLKFDISTVYYKTIWFWILVTFLLLTLLILYVYKRKLENQKITFQQQLALEQQRNKITADLHDDIGATLSSLQLNSSIANQLIKKDLPRAEMLLDKIENQSKDLADKIGDIIWSMKPGKDEFMTMSSRIKNFANDILGATTIDYTININSEIDTMLTDITTRKNIVLIAKETINNIVKYSNAKNVHIAFEKENNSLLLSISDDGIGFNPEIVKGNGITNMKRRAIEINGEFNIISSEKKGTSITLQIQCP